MSSIQSIHWGRALLTACIAMLLMIASAFFWVFIYSAFIEPGHSHEFYEAYAQKASPIESIVFGIPFFLYIGWLTARKVKVAVYENVFVLWAFYLLIDVLITTVGFDASPFDMLGIWFTAHSTKLGMLLLGGFLALRQAEKSAE